MCDAVKNFIDHGMGFIIACRTIMVRRHHVLEYDSIYTPMPTSPLHFPCTPISFSFRYRPIFNLQISLCCSLKEQNTTRKLPSERSTDRDMKGSCQDAHFASSSLLPPLASSISSVPSMPSMVISTGAAVAVAVVVSFPVAFFSNASSLAFRRNQRMRAAPTLRLSSLARAGISICKKCG